MAERIILEGRGNIAIKHARILKGPHQMAFDITNKCNFRCLHCFNRSGENIVVPNELDDDEVLKFIKDISRIKLFNLCFCGGEPLLRKKVLYESAKILKNKGTLLSLVTNGWYISYNIAKELKNIGITRIQVSIEGAKAETHEKLRPHKGAFDKAISAIKHFCDVEMEDISIAFTPTKFNCSEFEETIELMKGLGVKSVRVQPLMILGRAQLHLKELLPTTLQYRQLVRTIFMFQEKYHPSEFNIEWGDPIDHLIRFRTLAEHCINYANIHANGDIAPSPYLPLVIGNIRRHSFQKYWDKGLARLWELELVKEIAKQIISIADMGKKREGIPKVWFEENIKVDFIDDGLYKQLKNGEKQ